MGKLETLRSAAAAFSPQGSIAANRKSDSGKFSGWCEIKNEIFLFALVFFLSFIFFFNFFNFYFSFMQSIGTEKPWKYILPYGSILCYVSCKFNLQTSMEMWLMLFCSVGLTLVWIYAL